MSAERLREAAKVLRDPVRCNRPAYEDALADWLDEEAGLDCCSNGCIESPSDCLQRSAFAVADAILGGTK